MNRIVYFMLPLYGHVNPNLNLLKQLSESSDKVTCYITPKFKHIFERFNIEVKYYTDQVEEFYRLPATIQDDKQASAFQIDTSREGRNFAMRKSMEVVSSVYNAHINEVQALAPRYILYDSLANWGSVFGEKLGVPYFAIESATWDDVSNQNQVYKDYLKDIVEKENNTPLNIEQLILQKKKMARELVNRYSAIIGERRKYSPNLSIAHASPMLQIESDKLDDSYRYCGFYMDIKERKAKDKQLIYLTRGTTQNQSELNVLKKMMICLGHSGYKVEVSGGGKAQHNLLMYNREEIPGGIAIHEFVNQVEVLTKARIMVCHGGLTGVREAIFCDTPMIIYPYNYHCYQVGRAVEKAKAGILLKEYPFNPQELIEAVKRIEEDDSYQQGVQNIKEELINTYHTTSVLSIIEQYMEENIKE